MADLDDFFAKKDKKKKGKKSKKFVGTNPAAIAKALESTSPPPSTETDKPKDVQIELPSSTAMDDEWREVEENKEDLEGLKVRSLRAEESKECVVKKDEDGNDIQNEGDGNVEVSSASAWQSVVAQQPSESEVEEVPTIPEVVNEPTPPAPAPVPAPTKYVPPYLRNNSSRGSSQLRGPGRRRVGAPPDILSSEAFPTLGGTQ